MEEKGSGAACRVEDMLLDGTVNGVTNHLRRQPVGRVVLAEAMPLVAINQRLIERLHHVAFDLGEAEAAHVRHDLSDKLRALGIAYDPVEKVAFDRSAYSRACQRLSRKQTRRVVFIEAEHGEGDAFRDDHEIRVLQPQEVSLDVAAIDDFEKLRPKLTLEHDRWARIAASPTNTRSFDVAARNATESAPSSIRTVAGSGGGETFSASAPSSQAMNSPGFSGSRIVSFILTSAAPFRASTAKAARPMRCR